ncbi:hypothetical protein HYY71_07335 [Candidatus Woesearchaeota archaeon]|nr:hypothetical protein [Candidatus Woesearchaeota archaeon]
MRLEDLPEIKDGMIAEIGFINPDEPKADPKFRLFYIERIRYLKKVTPFDGSDAYFEEVDKESAERDFTALRIYMIKRQTDDSKLRFEEKGNVNLDAIVSFRPLEYKPQEGLK